MQDWCPFAKRNPANKDGGSYIGAKWKILLHTTEAKWFRPNSTNYYGHSSYPHFTIEPDGTVWQHIPIDRAARATKNLSGGVETNRANMIQIEICWKAAEAEQMPRELLDAVAKLSKWIMSQVYVPAKAPDVGFLPYPKSYGSKAGARFSHNSWYNFNGFLGHQHVPENDHGDPGRINIDYIFGILKGQPAPKTGTATTKPPHVHFTFKYSDVLSVKRPLMRGEAVKEWQRALLRWNPKALPRDGADGYFGGEAEAWTKKFQAARGLTVDGVVGRNTRAAMIKAIC